MGSILFVYTAKASFVRQDLDCLRENYDVKELPFNNKGTAALMLSMIRQLFVLPFLLMNRKMVYIWFGDYHSFLPVFIARLMGKTSFLVVGGYDVVRNPILNYGSFKNPLRTACTYYSMKRASLNLCVSTNVLRKVKAIVPAARVCLLHNGVPERPFDKVNKNPKKVICVASLTTRQKLFIKGIDRMVEAARIAPDFEFHIVGVYPQAYPDFMAELPSNVKWVPFLPQEELASHMAEAQIYLQLSREESFCLAMAEAMLCNCVPIYSPVGGLPEVAGPCGEAVKDPRPVNIVKVLNKWSGTQADDKPSDWIRAHYLLAKRNRTLIELCDPILR